VKRREQCPVKVIVWGCICIHGVGTIAKVDGNINMEKYIQVLEEHLWPVLARHYPSNDCVFQDDNTPVHRAHVVQRYMASNRLKTKSWPAQ